MKTGILATSIFAVSNASFKTEFGTGLQNFVLGAVETILTQGIDAEEFDFSVSTCYQDAVELNASIEEWATLSNSASATDIFFQAGIQLSVMNTDCNLNGLNQYINQRSVSTSALVGTIADVGVEAVMGAVYFFTDNDDAWHENVYYGLYEAMNNYSGKALGAASFKFLATSMNFKAPVSNTSLGTY